MALVEMVMPKMGESIIEATVIKWLKKEGDLIEKDESVLEVATDKVDTEVPSVSAGKLHKILVKDGEIAKVGSALALISDEVEEVYLPPIKTPLQPVEAEKIATEMEKVASQFVPTDRPAAGRFYSPLVLNIAREERISMLELEQIPGSGKDNRVTKYDILDYLTKRESAPIPPLVKPAVQDSVLPEVAKSPVQSTAPQRAPSVEVVSTPMEYVSKPAHSYSGEYEIIEMDRMRKIIAQRMIDSQRISATVTSFVEADVTNMVIWKNKIKHEFMKREGEGMTYTPIFVEAISRALKDYPMVNSSIDGDKIILKKNINIGIAVALNDGNLIVPVLKNADRYNITGLTKAVNEIVRKAKAGKLTADDLSDGTYTISNVGSFGNVMGTPILVQPQVGIMALGTIKKKPAVIETEQGDTLGIRHIMFLSHSYDHRIVDGALGGSFVRKVADYLENFDVHRKL